MKKIIFLLAIILGVFPALAQNVGIGTSTPTRAKLELHGAVDATTAIFGGESSGISLQRNWPGIGLNSYWNGGDRLLSNGYAAKLHMDPAGGNFYIDVMPSGAANALTGPGTRSITITNNGNVGIRNAVGDASLTVSRGNGTSTAIFNGTTHHSYINNSGTENTFIRGGKNGSSVYINDIPGAKIIMGTSDCMVGINTGIPEYTLEVRQVNAKGLALESPLGNTWEIFNGNLPLFFKYNTVSKSFIDWEDGRYAQVSDARLKKNILPVPGIMNKILQLNPVAYDMLSASAGKEKRLGFIAQEVYKLFPELVSILPDSLHGHKGINDLHMMDYSGFGVLAIKAIQEQQLQIETLKNEINELRKLIYSRK